ncbi:toxin VasX [Pseudomonas sp. dw_612]|uniref:toxin VasX n=1 Tax=Pseudomonas sp. dw_612 TaxID=2720080 RepID=UPI001BD45970|nr:toxin VasX [Pseudomonas sp. dw_612]
MTTPTSSGKSPNSVAKSQDDGKCAMGGCSLMKAKIQLIPLRYGLVERLDPSNELAMPYKTTSRPLGIRLIRDGWLYVIVDKTPQVIMHEYRIQNGIVTQLLWEKGEITANKRESNVGEAVLVFPRLSKLYVNYSEVQWTAAKCSQVIKHKSERNYFMQSVDLTKADPEKGAANLLTPSQAEKWIAEVAEQPSKDPAVTGAKPEESQDYLWEQASQFKKIQLGTLKKQVKTDNERDHLYLVIQDDLGVLRDLAEHQDLVTGWISDWSDAEANQKKYVFGCYIESLYTVTSDTILNAAQGDPRFAQLKDETTEEQRQTIVDYVNVKNQTQYSGAGTHRGAIAAAKSRMRTSLMSLYSKYETLIETIDDNTDDALDGAKMGQQGISDLIDRPAMEAFLKQQKTQLSRWNKRLDLISKDRANLVSEERFHRSAWYFDPKIEDQLNTTLATEYACIRDICRTDLATEKLADLIEKQPGFNVPTFFTLSLADQKDMHAKVASFVKSLRDSAMAQKDYVGAQELSGKFGNLLTQNLAAAMQLKEDSIVLGQLRDTAYEPAKQLRLAGALDNAMQALRNGQPLDPAKVLREIPGSAWINVLRAFNKKGITLEFSSASQIEKFKADIVSLTDLRKQMSSLKNQIKQTISKERKGLAAKGGYKALVTRRKAIQQTIAPLEGRVAQAMSPIGDGPSKAAFKIKGLNNAQLVEFERMAEDYRLKRPYKGLSGDVFKSVGGDLFASAAFIMQTVNFYQVYVELRSKAVRDSADNIAFFNALFSTIGGGLAAAQGIAITSLSVAIKNYTSAAGKIKLAAKLGKITGALSPFAYIFSAVAAGTSIYGEKGSAAKWTEALRSGNGAKLAGASMTLAGDSGQLALNGWAFAQSGKSIYEAFTTVNEARALVWVKAGSQLLSVAAKANLIGLVLTGLQLGGEFLYNRNNKTELDTWLQKGPWGKQSANHSMAEERLLLADITAAPQVALQSVNNQPMAVLRIPGITARELNDVEFGVSAYWLTNHQRNDWEAWSEPLLYQLNLLSAPDEPLKLGMDIFQHEANAQHGLAIAVRYHPVAGDTTYREKRFETTTLNPQNGKLLPAVSVLKSRNTDAPWLLVNSDFL